MSIRELKQAEEFGILADRKQCWFPENSGGVSTCSSLGLYFPTPGKPPTTRLTL